MTTEARPEELFVREWSLASYAELNVLGTIRAIVPTSGFSPVASDIRYVRASAHEARIATLEKDLAAAQSDKYLLTRQAMEQQEEIAELRAQLVKDLPAAAERAENAEGNLNRIAITVAMVNDSEGFPEGMTHRQWLVISDAAGAPV